MQTGGLRRETSGCPPIKLARGVEGGRAPLMFLAILQKSFPNSAILQKSFPNSHEPAGRAGTIAIDFETFYRT